eukprot:11211246-Lingulodinium_polyedra.AAC.1
MRTAPCGRFSAYRMRPFAVSRLFKSWSPTDANFGTHGQARKRVASAPRARASRTWQRLQMQKRIRLMS